MQPDPATVQTTGATALVRPHYRDELPVLWFSIAALLFGWLLHVGTEATRDAPYFGLAVSQFTASATLGMLVFHIASRPGQKSILVSIALGGVLAFELLVQSEKLPDATLFGNCLAIGLGLGSGLVLLRNAFSQDADERTGARNALLPGLTLPLFALSSS